MIHSAGALFHTAKSHTHTHVMRSDDDYSDDDDDDDVVIMDTLNTESPSLSVARHIS